MKTSYSEFVLTHIFVGVIFDYTYFAQITVKTETGALWWKSVKIERLQIARKNIGCWYFVDNGKFCQGFEVEALEQSYRAKELLNDLPITSHNRC